MGQPQIDISDEDVSTSTSAVDIELVRGALSAAQQEMGVLLERTAMSPIIREKQDYFCGLFDKDCRLLIGSRMPVGGSIVPPILETFPAAEMRPGDVYWYNDCYGSGGCVSHSPDEVFVRPVFVDRELVGYAFAWAHFLDIGGMQPGSTTPGATSIFHEGIIVPPVRLYREGVLNEDLLRVFIRNSRFPEVNRGDTRALLAATRLGDQRLGAIVGRYGSENAGRIFDKLIERTREAIDVRMSQIFKKGVYRFADSLDDDGHGSGTVTVRATLTVDDEGMDLDLSATDDETKGPINFLMHDTVPKMIFGMFMIGDRPELLVNEGMMYCLRSIRTRERSLLKPSFPAALGQRAMTIARLQSACFGLISCAAPEHAHASSSAYSIASIGGTNDGKSFLKVMGFGVGHGARPHADGIDAVYYVAQKNYPIEFAEQNYPLRIRRYAINPDSGGAGKYRGGCGIIREVEVLCESAFVSLRMPNVVNPTYGVVGGLNGQSGRFIVNPGTSSERRLPALAEGVVLKRGDLLSIQTPGGGGFGHPLDRDPAAVARDVLRGFVSSEAAREQYGVVLNSDGSVEPTETEALRKSRPRISGDVHRTRYFANDDWYAHSL